MKARACLVMLSTIVLCATLGRLAAEEPESGIILVPKGTKKVAVKLVPYKLPEGADPGVAVDIVGEICEPIKTGIALLNVKLLAVDSQPIGGKQEQAVLVALTPAQMEVLDLMKKHGAKLRIKLHDKEKPKQ
jgi:hypothetical protein